MRDQLHGPIAALVAILFVDFLTLIEVDQQDRGAAAGALHVIDLSLREFQKVYAVAKPGQGVEATLRIVSRPQSAKAQPEHGRDGEQQQRGGAEPENQAFQPVWGKGIEHHFRTGVVSFPV